MEPMLRAAPIPGVRNKYVITARESFFTVYDGGSRSPSYIAILRAAFDLDDSSVMQRLDDDFEKRRIVLGYYLPGAGEITVEFPASPTPFATARVREVIVV